MLEGRRKSNGVRTSKSISLCAGLMVALVGQLAIAPVMAAESSVNFKIYSPQEPPQSSSSSASSESSPSSSSSSSAGGSDSIFESEAPKLDEATSSDSKTTSGSTSSTSSSSSESKVGSTESTAETSSTTASESSSPSTESSTTSSTSSSGSSEKVLQGYIRVVPTGTKIPIIMDTAVDSDTSQEGDEFSARTAEDLTIDGSTVVPAGSIIKGRIAQMNGPRALNRSGSVALKFDTITTPDNRQIPLVANIVARGGVVHARRGMKDVALDCGTVSLPTLAGLGIGVLAGGSSSSSSSSSSSGVGRAGGAMIGAGIGLAVGVAVLLAKKGKKVEVRPGDELKIELAEELRMPTM
ncbi:MAG: hypothetical protein BWY75_02461 [bacterium ADurb.Bin425]|nr:MAG: hypothetical protein BWY75_02461 [bacterium ADurb.Bin425]